MSNLGASPDLRGHRRQYSQGYFDASMPSASTRDHTLNPSTIAAQTAMQHLALPGRHMRRQSSTNPVEDDYMTRRSSYDSSSSKERSLSPANEVPQYRNGLVGNMAATTAATAVWRPPEQEREKKGGLRRFRPKHIGIIRDKDKETKPMLSPNKAPSGLSKVYNASSVSLADTLSTNNSMFNLQNNSVTTILPADEKKKHLGLRQKLKLKDKDEGIHLSSAASNSRPVDVNNPQSLYSFAPSSPGASTFTKSMSGLDLRHGARALRKDKKAEKEREREAEAKLSLDQVYHKSEVDASEWPALSLTSSDGHHPTPYSKEMAQTLSQFGLNNMTPDDAWEFLKARLLVVFEGERVPIAIEDLNRLVAIHVQRCVLKRDPSIIIGDFENLLHTGFASLSHTLRGIREEGLVSQLVGMWSSVFGSILPFIQAVFLPLDQEFKGRGSVLKTPALAAEFWGALPSPDSIGRLSSSPSSAVDDTQADVSAGEELEVRRMLLMSFRDHVILPRFEVLKNTFSRLSLDSINATLAQFDAAAQRVRGNSLVSSHSSVGVDPRISSSYSSQTSTLLGGATPHSTTRSRATSGVSSGSASDVAFQSFSSPPPVRPGDTTTYAVTETVGRMLQCLSVLCSVQSNDDAQTKMEELTRELKLNWLGRGRTGRNRKGFVGTRIPRGREGVMSSGIRSIASTIRGQERDRDGSPTPTPTRQGTIVERSGAGGH